MILEERTSQLSEHVIYIGNKNLITLDYGIGGCTIVVNLGHIIAFVMVFWAYNDCDIRLWHPAAQIFCIARVIGSTIVDFLLVNLLKKIIPIDLVVVAFDVIIFSKY